MQRLYGRRPAPLLMAGAIAALLGMAPAAANEGDVWRGGELAKRWCATCHVVDAQGTGTAVDTAPPFPSMAASSGDALRGAITGPHIQMPQLDIGRREVDDLIAYIRSLAGPR